MLILAPMQGLTELMFRRVYEACFPGALDLAISPFLSLTHGNLAEAWKKIDDVLPEANQGSIPVIPQILGKEPREFIELGNRLADLGYTEITWNIGCPKRRVTAKHRGSGILPHPDEVQLILDTVLPQLRPRLSVKMRLGLSDKRDITALIPILNDHPLASITIHPRTGRQQYGGQVDLDAFEEALHRLHHPVIYNGDICTPADYRKLHTRFPQVNDFMIGRGILYNPLLPLEIKNENHNQLQPNQLNNPTTQQFNNSSIQQFITSLLSAIEALPIPPVSKMRKTKEYWCLLRRSLPVTEQQAATVLHAETHESTLDTLLRLLDSVADRQKDGTEMQNFL